MKELYRRGMVVRIVKTVLSLVAIIGVVVGLMFVNPRLSTNKFLSNLMGYNKSSIDNSSADTDDVDLEYYKSDYTINNIRDAENDLDSRIGREGVVMLKNDDHALPMKSGASVSFFSANSVEGSATTASFMPSSGDTGSDLITLKDSFEKAGFTVNDKLWQFYESGTGKNYGLGEGSVSYGDDEDFKINEAPLSVLQKESGLLDSVKGTTPVYVLSRVAGEGRDMPRSMANHAAGEEDRRLTYLDLDSTEREIIKYLNDNFETVMLLVKSNAALNLGWLKDYPHIKAVVSSENITNAIGEVFAGTVNPSGRTVDTFATDALKSPAAQNFGDYQYVDENGELTKYNYVSYEEGIYVGYRYYETRYEDSVLGQGNAGDYNYADEVVYPFGYGLGYTTFKQTDFQLSRKSDTFTASVNVTNTGNVAGKDVVEVYMQSPYTDYDKKNGVEKSSVELVAFGKSNELEPGASERVSVTFEADQLKSYDSNNAKTYILDAGEYLFTAAADSNKAVNNMLAYKGKTVSDGMTAEGDRSMVAAYAPDNTEVDTVTYSKDSQTGVEVTNQFDDARGDMTYLTRSDWTGTFPAHDGEVSNQVSTWGNEINGTKEDGSVESYTWTKVASADLIKQLDSTDSGNPVEASKITDTPVFGKNNGKSLIEMRGLDFDDDAWNDLLDQLTEEDYRKVIIESGYGIDYLKSVNKPYDIDADGASGWVLGGATSRRFPNMIVLAQTWNVDLAREFGEMRGNEALLGGADGMYAPSVNIHRTPFSGRNGEYFSEDEFLTGAMASQIVLGTAEKGVYSYVKHFVLNDQEDHRGDRVGQYSIATWANEQSIREIYLKPFELCMKVGDIEINYVKQNSDGKYENATAKIPATKGIMTSFNRIGATWAGGDYDLISGVLRGEWGFNGVVVTDNANTSVFMSNYQMIESGADIKLLAGPDPAYEKELNLKDSATYHYARAALHRTLYTIANSKAMNGAMPGSVFKYYNQMKVAQVAVNAGAIVVIGALAFFSVWRWLPMTVRRVAARKERRAMRKAARSVSSK